MVLVENYLKMFALKEAVQPAGGTGGVTIVLCNYFLDDGQRINCHKKKLCKLPRLPHSLHTNYGREQARPSKVQTLVKTSLNVATELKYYCPVPLRGRGVQMQLQIEMVIFIK